MGAAVIKAWAQLINKPQAPPNERRLAGLRHFRPRRRPWNFRAAQTVYFTWRMGGATGVPNADFDPGNVTLRQSPTPPTAIDGWGRVAHTETMDRPFSYGSGQKLRLKCELAGQLYEKIATGHHPDVPYVPRFAEPASSFENGWRGTLDAIAYGKRLPSNRCKLRETRTPTRLEVTIYRMLA